MRARRGELAGATSALEQVRADCDRVTREADQAERALHRVGGAPLREELARVDDALALAKERADSLDLDAQAWRLLRETLKEADTSRGEPSAAPSPDR